MKTDGLHFASFYKYPYATRYKRKKTFRGTLINIQLIFGKSDKLIIKINRQKQEDRQTIIYTKLKRQILTDKGTQTKVDRERQTDRQTDKGRQTQVDRQRQTD